MEIRRPVRVEHGYTQSLAGSPEEVFPLLCPVREADWVPGWEPGLVVSASGVAEPDCVFVTPDPAAGDDAEAVWTVLRHDATVREVEMLKVTPGFLVVRLAIAVRPRDGGGCHADVTYRYTALGPAGEEYVRGMTREAWAEFMRAWESALNAYLRSC
jgi:hypothetical protein